jgi:elongator complex protein 3
MTEKDAYRAILDKILLGDFENEKDLTKVKLWACKRYALTQFPKNSQILATATEEEKEKVLSILKLKPIRAISGVTIITVMPKPFPCPKEQPCTYCPGGPDDGTPQSYTGNEPAGRRAIENDFDPYKQVSGRIKQFQIMGHTVDKVELIMFGGTLTAYPPEYLEWFTIQCLNALSGSDAKTIDEAQHAAEHATIKNSDITIETRPDYCKQPHVDFMLRLGVTRVELGVQTVYDDVYKQVNRGHSVEDVIEATRIAKDAGYVVIYHMMPGLMGSDFSRDLAAFETIFQDQRFKPDAVKIYPTLVIPNTKLHMQWKNGEYHPYSQEETIELISTIKEHVPRWVRIQRIQRDIPSNQIAAGIKKGDLRNLIQKKMKQDGTHCQCIRCREIGHVQYKSRNALEINDVNLLVSRYPASEGEELFLSIEDESQDVLIGSLRLRCPSQHAHRPEIIHQKTMLVRELHVYGPMVQVGSKAEKNEWQHKGWGEQLMNEAERISKETFDADAISVLAGIGTRNYYKRFGYERSGPYMTKNI